MRFVWPPIIRAIDERTNKIASGLEYADKTKNEYKNAEIKIQDDLKRAHQEITSRLQESEKKAVAIIEQARCKLVKKQRQYLRQQKKRPKPRF